MPWFVVNTKLGTAMIDSVGGPMRVNNLLSTLNIPTIGNKNMKRKWRDVLGNIIETALASICLCRQNLLHKIKEMEDVHHEESMVSEHNIMEDLIDKISEDVLCQMFASTKVSTGSLFSVFCLFTKVKDYAKLTGVVELFVLCQLLQYMNISPYTVCTYVFFFIQGHIHQSNATVTNDSEWSDLYNCDEQSSTIHQTKMPIKL
ncbi:uncharacterized protein LOC132738835, partial [Ruditapes philippinarum]|uniref:uncharacterized protein LOC132738835 n=1 Tax=Ruditapes philippinarum TaxID=129788 RepID=UPI00295A5B7F